MKGEAVKKQAQERLLGQLRRAFIFQVWMKGGQHPDVMEVSGRYSDMLRTVADTTKSDAERDLWIQYELAVTYLKAFLLRDAIQAIKDGQDVMSNEWTYRRNPNVPSYERRFKRLVRGLRWFAKQLR